MKFGRNKSPSSPKSNTTTTTSIISRAFPASWFSKFKKKAVNSEFKDLIEHRGKLDFATPNSSLNCSLKQGRFYSMDSDDAYWRISFGEERKISYDHCHDAFRFQGGDEYRNFNDMVLDIKKMKDKQKSNDRRSRRKEAEIYEEKLSKSSENIVPLNEKVRINEFLEMKMKTEPCTRKVKPSSRAKTYSPRTECKIRAIEEMKKARGKLKKMNEMKGERVMHGRTHVFDSYAVVKSSFNPGRDFRESMVEMIREKRIRRSEELEELLACYLTLNSDEYHELIIKVFRKVWFELNGACLDPHILHD